MLSDRPDDGGSKHLWNVGNLVPEHQTQSSGSKFNLSLQGATPT
jgi:hypothetical protein